jgi:hypothetical protein
MTHSSQVRIDAVSMTEEARKNYQLVAAAIREFGTPNKQVRNPRLLSRQIIRKMMLHSSIFLYANETIKADSSPKIRI